MVIIMNLRRKYRQIISLLLIALLAAALIIPTVVPVSAANKRFITEIRVETGEEAVAALEQDGWSVTMVGLNAIADPASQVYLAYKMNTGSPITDVVLSPDAGDSISVGDGITYNCVSHVDVDEGIGGGAGCLYATTDERAGAPLVGLDVLRGSEGDESVLYPITNDGAEIVRTPEGAPADLEASSDTNVVYLAQIRDGIVRPYISEIGVITDSDKWNAVYTACERGYNYYVDGDIDDSPDTYTIIGYERTADPKAAVTDIKAITEDAVKSADDGQADNKKSAAATISGAEYVRISSQPIAGETPYYIYRSKDAKAGNPISMLYAEKVEKEQYYLFGTWANTYFFTPGVTTAYSYCMNEDLYASLWEDQTVFTMLPVRLFESLTSYNPLAAPTEAKPAETEAPAETAPPQEEAPQENAEEVPQENAEEAPQENAENPAEEAPQENAEQVAQNPDGGENPPAEEAADAAPEEPATEAPATQAPTEPAENSAYIRLSVLTPRDGLPASATGSIGLNGDPSTPYVERTGRGDRVNKYQASVFSTGGGIALIAGGVVIIAAAVYAIIQKKRTDGKKSEDSKKPKQGKKSKKQHKSKKSR